MKTKQRTTWRSSNSAGLEEKKVRHQTNRDAGEKMGALSSKKGRNFTNTQNAM